MKFAGASEAELLQIALELGGDPRTIAELTYMRVMADSNLRGHGFVEANVLVWGLENLPDPVSFLDGLAQLGVSPQKTILSMTDEALFRLDIARKAGLPAWFLACLESGTIAFRNLPEGADLSWFTLTAHDPVEISDCLHEVALPPRIDFLDSLTIRGCTSLRVLPRLWSTGAGVLVLEDCPALERIESMEGIARISIRRCPRLRALPGALEGFRHLEICDCPALSRTILQCHKDAVHPG
jgi:hypothetical protein